MRVSSRICPLRFPLPRKSSKSSAGSPKRLRPPTMLKSNSVARAYCGRTLADVDTAARPSKMVCEWGSTLMKHTIEAAEKPLLDIFCDKYLFRIPSYQRPYAWEKEQTGELYDDIFAACGS